MATTYDETLPTDLDRVRAILGDTDVSPAADALFTDEHINAVLIAEGSLAAGVVFLAEELIARFGQEPVRVAVNGKTVDFSERITIWKTLAQRMQTRANGGSLTF